MSWRSLEDTDYDIVSAYSIDQGSLWSDLFQAHYSDNDDPDLVPQMATDHLGNWVVVWASSRDASDDEGEDGDIFTTQWNWDGLDVDEDGVSNDDETNTYSTDFTLSDSNGDGINEGDEIFVHSTHPTNADTDGDGFSDGTELAGDTDPNDPGSFATFPLEIPRFLNTNAFTNTGYDNGPSITTDGLGNWLTVWYLNDLLDNTIEADFDILQSRSTNNGAT